MNVYTRIDGHLAKFDAETLDHRIAIYEVMRFMADCGHLVRNCPVFAVIDGGTGNGKRGDL